MWMDYPLTFSRKAEERREYAVRYDIANQLCEISESAVAGGLCYAMTGRSYFFLIGAVASMFVRDVQKTFHEQ